MRFKSIFILVLLCFQLFALSHPVSAEMVETADFILIDVKWGRPGGPVLEPKPGDKMVPLTITVMHTSPYPITEVKAELRFSSWRFKSSTGERSTYSSAPGSYEASEQIQFVFTVDIHDDAELGTYTVSMWIDYRYTFEEERRERYVGVPIKLLGTPAIDYLLYPNKLSPGEINDLTLVIMNDGSAPAYSLESFFSSEMMVPVESDASWAIPRLLPGENVTLPLKLYVYPDLQDQVAQSEVTTTYSTAHGNNRTEAKEFSFVVGSFFTNLFEVAVSTTSLKESQINDLSLTMTYLGTSPLRDIEVFATVNSPAVIVENDHWVIEQLDLNQQLSLPIQIYASSAGQSTNLSITIKYADTMGVRVTETKQLGLFTNPTLKGSLLFQLKTLKVKAGMVNEVIALMANGRNQDIIDVEVSVDIPQPLDVVGSSKWTVSLLNPNEARELTINIYAPPSSIASISTMTFTVEYRDALGEKITETHNLSFAILEKVQTSTIDLKPLSTDVKADAVNEIVVLLVNNNQRLIDVEVSIDVQQPFGVVGLNSWYIATLMPNESKELTFGLYAPESSTDSVGSIDFTLKYLDELGNSNTETQSLGFAVLESLQAQEVELISTFPDMSAEIGKTVQYPITIKNVGDDDKLFILSVLSSPKDWEVAFKSGILEVQSILIDADQSEALTVEVTSSDDATPDLYPIIVQAAPQDGGSVAVLKLMVDLKEAKTEFEVIAAFTDVTGEAGKVLQYPITLRNLGDEDAVYLLSVLLAPENWDVAFLSEDIEISSAQLTADESLSLVVRVEPPSTVSAGNYTIIIQAGSEKKELRAKIAGSYELGLEPSTLATRATIGGEVSITARVTNDGQSPITSIFLDVGAPDGWEVTVTPAQLSSLSPRESFTFTVKSKLPADTVAGDYMISLKAEGDQVTSDEVQSRVTAETSTEWGLIGVGIAAAMIISLIFVFKKFSRR